MIHFSPLSTLLAFHAVIYIQTPLILVLKAAGFIVQTMPAYIRSLQLENLKESNNTQSRGEWEASGIVKLSQKQCMSSALRGYILHFCVTHLS